jgi:hypothetical protein
MSGDPDEAPKELRRLIESDMTLAEHRDHGHSHVEISCAACHKTSLMPFRLMSPEQLSLTLSEFEKQMRCEKCGAMFETVTPWRQTGPYAS